MAGDVLRTRAREHAASWDEIGAATGTTGEAARAAYAATVERQEQHGSGLTDLTPYRAVLDDSLTLGPPNDSGS